MATKELTVDQHNKALDVKIKKLEDELKDLQSQYKSEALKPQATLAQCNAIAMKQKKVSKKP